MYAKEFVQNVCSFKEDEGFCLRLAKIIEDKLKEKP